jgi:tRNA A-37 threonylcarbamoyl transferase component Bud32
VTEQHEIYCLADRLFYESPDQRQDEHPDFAILSEPVPDGWQHSSSETWMYYAPNDCKIPAQGWKIHISSSLADAERVLDATWEYCIPRGIAFKFLRNKPVMVMINSKSAFRGSSGKLVTIYPQDEAQLELMLKELDGILRGVEGPYILSDLRFAEGPLFTRYGGFIEQHCLDEAGNRVLALGDGNGELVPDVRGAVFAIPSWITLPEFLRPHLEARNSVSVEDIPYEIQSVLQFSNGGGVYLGIDKRTGRTVVLKEGRPYAGLDVAGRDAVTRIKHERDVLSRLADLDVVPALLDYFELGDHHFLVEEFVDGNPLQRKLVHRFPLTHPDPSPETLAEYAEWALTMIDKVETAVAAMHERGVVFGDLHPMNILVTEDERLVLIDFEVASLAKDEESAKLGHPAYQAPQDRRGTDIDNYALACLRLTMFAPQTTILLGLHSGKAQQLADLVTRYFPTVPKATVADAVRTIRGASNEGDREMAELPMPEDEDWPRLRDALAKAILASATPHRSDRLYPGDIQGFQPGGGLNFANGAAGVLYTLAAAGAQRVPEHEDWLRRHAKTAVHKTEIGFYNGLHGIAHVLDALGYQQDALDTVDRTLQADWTERELGLYGGLAGIGLNLLHFADRTGDPAFTDLASRAIDAVADRLGGVADVPEISGGDYPRAGLMYGSSGPALLFMRAYERSGDAALLDLAATALAQDLRRCVPNDEDDTLQVNQGWRRLPYLDEGSVGIALALDRYLRHRENDAFSVALDQLRLINRSGFFVQPGLFAGVSGILASVGMERPDREPDALTVKALLRSLSWHALPYGGGLAYPGDQLFRLSMDFATGTAGVLFALATALHPQPVRLPLFDPPGSQNLSPKVP